MPSFFIPARDSRHRAACFALYRALFRQVPHIQLPGDVTSRPGWINPILYLIRSGFRRNKNDTSPRLVTSALQSGYRFITLLTQARDPSSPHHDDVVSFLRERQSKFPPARNPAEPGQQEGEEGDSRQKAAGAAPLLTKISRPGQKPIYKSTVRPRPLSELSGGVRKVPVLDAATGGHTFMRIGKPQSHFLGSFLHRKGDRRQRRITLMQDLQDEHLAEALDEERWEAELVRLARAEGVQLDGYGAEDQGIGARTGSYQESVREAIKYVGEGLTREVEDMAARTTAMLDIIEEEKKLAAVEAKDRERQKRRERATRKRLRKEKAEREERMRQRL